MPCFVISVPTTHLAKQSENCARNGSPGAENNGGISLYFFSESNFSRKCQRMKQLSMYSFRSSERRKKAVPRKRNSLLISRGPELSRALAVLKSSSRLQRKCIEPCPNCQRNTFDRKFAEIAIQTKYVPTLNIFSYCCKKIIEGTAT